MLIIGLFSQVTLGLWGICPTQATCSGEPWGHQHQHTCYGASGWLRVTKLGDRTVRTGSVSSDARSTPAFTSMGMDGTRSSSCGSGHSPGPWLWSRHHQTARRGMPREPGLCWWQSPERCWSPRPLPSAPPKQSNSLRMRQRKQPGRVLRGKQRSASPGQCFHAQKAASDSPAAPGASGMLSSSDGAAGRGAGQERSWPQTALAINSPSR